MAKFTEYYIEEINAKTEGTIHRGDLEGAVEKAEELVRKTSLTHMVYESTIHGHRRKALCTFARTVYM